MNGREAESRERSSLDIAALKVIEKEKPLKKYGHAQGFRIDLMNLLRLEFTSQSSREFEIVNHQQGTRRLDY